jgi:hypothetical protein
MAWYLRGFARGEKGGKMSQEVIRAKNDDHSGFFPHGDGIQCFPIELPRAGHRLGCCVGLGTS